MRQKINVDTRTFVRFWLVLLGLALLAFLAVKAVTGLIIIGISLLLAIAIRPLAKQIDKLDAKRSRPKMAAGTAYVIVMAVLILAVSLVGPVVVNETAHFVGQVPEMFENSLGGWEGINNFGQSIGVANLQNSIYEALKNFSNSFMDNLGNTVVTSVGVIASLMTGVILVMVLTLLFLLEGPTIMRKFWGLMESRQSDKQATRALRRTLSRMEGVVATYASKQVVVAALDGCVTALIVFVLSLLCGFSSGLALPMGLIAMIFYLIPMFGPIITCVLVSLILLFSMPWAALLFAISYIVYEQIENNLLAPKIQGDALNLPAAIILMAVVIGMYVWGLLGAIVAIPVAGCLKVLVEELPKLRSASQA